MRTRLGLTKGSPVSAFLLGPATSSSALRFGATALILLRLRLGGVTVLVAKVTSKARLA